MTEDQASKKWCPFVDGSCKASACMFWRDDLDRVLTGREIAVEDKSAPYSKRWHTEKETVPSGYCSVAGKPL